MAAEFYLPSLFNPARAKLEPLLEALVQVRDTFKAECEVVGTFDELAQEKVETVQSSIATVRRTLYSGQCGYFADPYNEYNLLSFCGLAEMRIFGIDGAPKDGAPVGEILRWSTLKLQDRQGWELLDALVENHQLSPTRTRFLFDKLCAAEPLLKQRLGSLANYWDELTGWPLTLPEMDEVIAHFKIAHADLKCLLWKAISTGEALEVSY